MVASYQSTKICGELLKQMKLWA